MKETLEIRINYDYAHLLFKNDEGRNIGTLVKIVEISKDDPRYKQIPIISKQVKEKYNKGFFFGWKIKREYNKSEIEKAPLFHFKIKTEFEPAGEECGTLYDESIACKICGANREQKGSLKLKYGSIPKKDIARTIAGEVIVSERFAMAYNDRDLKGSSCKQIYLDQGDLGYYQLVISSPKLELTEKTVAGETPFESSEKSTGSIYSVSGYEFVMAQEIYKCPLGHTIGLNLISEPQIFKTSAIKNYDVFESKQKIGVKRGLLRPEPIYFCSPAFRKMIIEEKLSGFYFEIAHIQK